MQTKDLNKIVLNLKTPKITQESLDDEIRSMFKSRKEGLDYINSQQWENDESKQNAMRRLDRVYPRRVKGSSPEYTQRINSQYEGVLPYKKPFTPTEKTIWDDPKHPLYGIAPSEQNEKFLNEAISEIARKTQSPAHWRFYGGASGGGTRLDAIKKLNQYKKALKYIKGE